MFPARPPGCAGAPGKHPRAGAAARLQRGSHAAVIQAVRACMCIFHPGQRLSCGSSAPSRPPERSRARAVANSGGTGRCCIASGRSCANAFLKVLYGESGLRPMDVLPGPAGGPATGAVPLPSRARPPSTSVYGSAMLGLQSIREATCMAPSLHVCGLLVLH
jgi:hypothetical protein